MNQYDVIRKPLITEKGMTKKEGENTLCFEVHVDANKVEIRSAVEKLFKVKVADVKGTVDSVESEPPGSIHEWHVEEEAAARRLYVSLSRPLQPGDPVTMIDWRRSASSDHLYLREREWEAAHTVWLWPRHGHRRPIRSSSAFTRNMDTQSIRDTPTR